MSFVVNGADWQFDGLAAPEVHKKVDGFLSLLADADRAGDTVWIGDDFQRRPMFADEDLWSLLGRNGRFALEDQLLQELTAWLMRAPYYADQDDWPAAADETNIAIGGAPVGSNTDVAWVHHSVRSGQRMGVFSLVRSGPVQTITSQGSIDLFFVVDPFDHQLFWRDILRKSARGLDLLQEIAHKAYPNIYFVEGAISGVDNLAGGYLPFRDAVQSCFEALSDHGAWIFTAPPPALTPTEPAGADSDAQPSRKIIEDRFHGFGITAAPEHSDVYAKRACRAAREVVVGGATLYCEWHIKLEKHQNRIHIHSPTPGSKNRVIVAVVNRHLPLPGD